MAMDHRPGQAARLRSTRRAADHRACAGVLMVALMMVVCLAGSPQVSAADQPSDRGAQAGWMTSIDHAGLRRDTGYFLGYQFAAVAFIGLWPRQTTNYAAADERGWNSWRQHVTHPRWDHDRAVVNYVLHPYWGAAYYTRARSRGLDHGAAFWFSALLSTIFEFGAEAVVEPVSYQDLVVTPLVGTWLGEHLLWPLRQRILARPGAPNWLERMVLLLTDPLGTINLGVDRLSTGQVHLGLLTPFDSRGAPPRLSRMAQGSDPPAPRPLARPGRWGLQLWVEW